MIHKDKEIEVLAELLVGMIKELQKHLDSDQLMEIWSNIQEGYCASCGCAKSE